MLPTKIYHADWSRHPDKRWQASASLRSDGRYLVNKPEKVGDLKKLISSLRTDTLPESCVLAGFDFPIGIPNSYANAAGVSSFKSFLGNLGKGNWVDFDSVCRDRAEISLFRPFYPNGPGGRRQSHLTEALGVDNIDCLRQECEKKHSKRRAACPLFWTLGANQVGKGALVGWRDVLKPSLAGSNCFLWPFDGTLAELLVPENTVLAETYPAEYYLGLFPGPLGKKSDIEVRKQASSALLSFQDQGRALFTPALEAEITAGFPEASNSGDDDAFDAVIGVLGMIKAMHAATKTPESFSATVKNIEGWILGQPFPITST